MRQLPSGDRARQLRKQARQALRLLEREVVVATTRLRGRDVDEQRVDSRGCIRAGRQGGRGAGVRQSRVRDVARAESVGWRIAGLVRRAEVADDVDLNVVWGPLDAVWPQLDGAGQRLDGGVPAAHVLREGRWLPTRGG